MAGLTGFRPCDALIAANLSHAVHLPSSPNYPTLVNGSWTTETQRSPWCFVQPSSSAEVSKTLQALHSAGGGAGDWHVAVRSGGHGSDNQNSITNGLIIDLTYLNATTYNAATNIASVGTGSRWGETYSILQEHGVSIVGGRQSIVGVGGLLLGGGVGWHTPRRGFGCDRVVNYEVVLASGTIINANASVHADLWRALKGGSSNFGIVTRFDIEAFPAQNLTLARRTVSEEYTDGYIDAIVEFANLDQSYWDNAINSVTSYAPGHGITMTVAEVNTANDLNTTAFDAFDRLPALTPSVRQSASLPDVANVQAPELKDKTPRVGGGPTTIANDKRVVRYLFEQHANLVADLNSTLGANNFSTILEFQPLPAWVADIGAQRGGNMLGLERSRRNKLYYVLGVTLLTPASQDKAAQVYQKISATGEKVKAFSKSIGADEEFIYLAYADAKQDPLGSYGAANVDFLKQVAHKYDPKCFFQRRVPGGFKLDRVG
ncbi:hypothetical protein E8E13_004047 [Curvularia kusanoi]|uniref:FAD-binding PCMH-type domain-containing protein n=1 Tax=Curvularia kusanoi TaxID=90978 RepID=A0A9P4W5N7_CURKU|nr:hypothetical protein E8E13_004047 [Curvularia kusanoi]